jgi:K+-transporting ATPase ATPase A chain
MAAGVALVRGLVRQRRAAIGNFWVDLVRGSLRILLPLSAFLAVILVALGVIQNLHGVTSSTSLAGTHPSLPGGPVASWEPIKLLSGDGGGALNANSAHPFENPGPVSNVLEISMMLLIPVAFIRTIGRLIGNQRPAWALLAVAAVLYAGGFAATAASQVAHPGVVPQAVGEATEGTETRFGVLAGAAFGATATATADGAADASYDSFTSLAGGMLMANMMLGEISPGGAGSGLYGLLMMALLAVFIAGLMIGRTPAYLRKRLQPREMKYVAGYLLASPAVTLIGAGVAIALPVGIHAASNAGPHGLSEVLYAFTSSANSNGSAFGGLSGNTDFYNVALAIVMLLGRYLPIVFVLALAGSFARQDARADTAGALRTHGPMFVSLVVATAILVVGLEFLPALSLGPIAERT